MYTECKILYKKHFRYLIKNKNLISNTNCNKAHLTSKH